MGQITKAFAENLLLRVQAGKHINTTVGEEEQLIRAWMYWHEYYYQPRLDALIAAQKQPIAAGGEGAAMQGSSFAAMHRISTKE